MKTDGFIDSDPRRDLARQWVASQMPGLGRQGWWPNLDSLRPASSDASFRRYFRIDGQAPREGDSTRQEGSESASLILMDAPPDREDIRPFIKVAEIFLSAGLQVPKIIAADPELGFLLCTDLGQQTYLQRLAENTGLDDDHQHKTRTELYREAWRSLVKLQTYGDRGGLPDYDATKLTQEMQLFDQWFLGHHRPIVLSASEKDQLATVYRLICDRCTAQPQVIVHRDYHSRNLMICPPHGPGVLDFQDAVIGPISYDLVSLLRDAYIEWPEELQIDWAIGYWQDARQAGLPIAQDFADFWKDFEWMGLQRHIKVLGIFARLYHRDGKENYLNDLPVVMRYAVAVARRYQGLGPLAKILERCA